MQELRFDIEVLTSCPCVSLKNVLNLVPVNWTRWVARLIGMGANSPPRTTPQTFVISTQSHHSLIALEADLLELDVESLFRVNLKPFEGVFEHEVTTLAKFKIVNDVVHVRHVLRFVGS